MGCHFCCQICCQRAVIIAPDLWHLRSVFGDGHSFALAHQVSFSGMASVVSRTAITSGM